MVQTGLRGNSVYLLSPNCDVISSMCVCVCVLTITVNIDEEIKVAKLQTEFQ